MRKWMPKALSLLGLVAGAAVADTAVELTYDDFEPGVEVARSRVLVTERWLRWDDGIDEGDYVLFDRQSNELFSVSHGDQSVLHVPRGKDLPAVPESLSITRQPSGSPAPKVGDHEIKSYEVQAMGQVCAAFSVAPELLPDAAAALRAYQMTLARSSLSRLSATPAEMHTPCFLGNNIYGVDLRYSAGLNIAERRADGRGRLLADFREGVKIAPILFTLPDYVRYQLPGSED